MLLLSLDKTSCLGFESAVRQQMEKLLGLKWYLYIHSLESQSNWQILVCLKAKWFEILYIWNDFFIPCREPQIQFENFYWYFVKLRKRLSNWCECWQEGNAEHDTATAYTHTQLSVLWEHHTCHENTLVCPWVPHAAQRVGTCVRSFRPVDSSTTLFVLWDRFVHLGPVRNSEMYCWISAAASVRRAQHSASVTEESW